MNLIDRARGCVKGRGVEPNTLTIAVTLPKQLPPVASKFQCVPADDSRRTSVDGPCVVVPRQMRLQSPYVVALDGKSRKQPFFVLALGLNQAVSGTNGRHVEPIAQWVLEIVVLEIREAKVRDRARVEDVRASQHAFLRIVAGWTGAGSGAIWVSRLIVGVPIGVSSEHLV